MKGYWIVLGADITDSDAQAQYGKLWGPIAEKYDAKLRSAEVTAVLLEAGSAKRVSVVEFPSLEQAKACYADPSYEEAKQYALKASNRALLIFEGELA
ncbi:hypothetical protein LMG28688_06348 [Paraburkholderia caffeinitolerans]|uniref:DUF1330 domain-containing protein n=1 Tax=Paraburkholderia caffeinitolerans TaxID=1723730 RepID=A0A6J5GX04_9BURK|nr:DUF1330 domain-containing protein [Paraburkholderia caffeinitolerans]CAB3806378.1 hypothetical protein LMG28688_06348 [Paraburkholderia caffeinitolerans]